MSKYDPRPLREDRQRRRGFGQAAAPAPSAAPRSGSSGPLVVVLAASLLIAIAVAIVLGMLLMRSTVVDQASRPGVEAPRPTVSRPIPPGTEPEPPTPVDPPAPPRPIPPGVGPRPQPLDRPQPPDAPEPTVRYVSRPVPDLLPPAAGPATFEGDHVSVKLPGTYRSFCVGASGRYLFAHVPDTDQVAVIDVLAGRIVHTIDGVSDDVIPAAGRNWLVLVKPGQRLMERIRLDTFKRDKVAPLPGDGTTTRAMMGYLSDGPLLVAARDAHLIDMPTLTPIDHKPTTGGQPERGTAMRIAPDGRSVGNITLGIGPIYYNFMRMTPGGTVNQRFSSTSNAQRFAQPNTDGSLVIRDGHDMFTGDLRHVPIQHLGKRTIFVTDDPRYLISLQHARTSAGEEGAALDVITNADRRIVLTKVGFTELGARGNTNERGSRSRFIWHSEGHFHYFVHLQVFAATDWDRRHIHLYKFNLVDELEATGVDYLYVESAPPYVATRGTRISYPISVRSKLGGVELNLASAPDGSSLDDDGVLTWAVPRDFANKTASFIVEVTDAGEQSILHSFDVGLK